MPKPPIIGAPGEALSGAECRVLRASLGMERRHVAAIASVLDGDPGGAQVSVHDVFRWERSREGAYPDWLGAVLSDLSHGVDDLARVIVGGSSIDNGSRTLHRPSRDEARERLAGYGGQRLANLGNVDGDGPGVLEPADDAWDAVVDAAMVRAALTFPSGVRVAA